jgi:hypothetical protein
MVNMKTLLIFIIAFFYGCERQSSSDKNIKLPISLKNVSWLDNAQVADSLAKINKSDGYIKLYDMAINEDGEASEYAIETLHHLLYTNTVCWVKSFSQLDSVEFEKFIRISGIAIAGEEEGEERYAPDFGEKVLHTLDSMNCNNSELRVRELIKEQIIFK